MRLITFILVLLASTQMFGQGILSVGGEPVRHSNGNLIYVHPEDIPDPAPPNQGGPTPSDWDDWVMDIKFDFEDQPDGYLVNHPGRTGPGGTWAGDYVDWFNDFGYTLTWSDGSADPSLNPDWLGQNSNDSIKNDPLFPGKKALKLSWIDTTYQYNGKTVYNSGSYKGGQSIVYATPNDHMRQEEEVWEISQFIFTPAWKPRQGGKPPNARLGQLRTGATSQMTVPYPENGQGSSPGLMWHDGSEGHVETGLTWRWYVYAHNYPTTVDPTPPLHYIAVSYTFGWTGNLINRIGYQSYIEDFVNNYPPEWEVISNGMHNYPINQNDYTLMTTLIRYVTKANEPGVQDFIEYYISADGVTAYLVNRLVNPGLTSPQCRANGNYGVREGHFGFWSGGGNAAQYHMPDQSVYISYWGLGWPAAYGTNGFAQKGYFNTNTATIPVPQD